MMAIHATAGRFVALMFVLASLPCIAGGQEARPQRGAGGQRRVIESPEVSSDAKVTFRIVAPQAEAVRLSGGDIPQVGRGMEMQKGEDGLWEVTVGPLDAGAYRYQFDVDGVPTMDPRNPQISQSNNNAWSLVYVPGSDWMDTREVPHGALAEVTYYSKSLQRFRRMHIYTPPGYENSDQRYPVFYLLHGASDSDDSWSTVGRANFILDNLIADKKAQPMLVVMPAGHTSSFRGFGGGTRSTVDEFTQDFLSDIMPYVESNYRVHSDRAHRAIAGLSMGGAQTLNIAVARLQDFGYFGVFSSGVFGGRGPGGGGGSSWEERNQEVLDNADLKKGLRLIWFATGKDDFLIGTSQATVEMLKKHDFDVTYQETAGGHTWINWRDYLHQFAPLLFREDAAAKVGEE